MVKIAVPLIGCGLSPDAVLAELRSKYDHTVPDGEIRDVVKWAIGKIPRPSGYGNPCYNSRTPVIIKSDADAAAKRAGWPEFEMGSGRDLLAVAKLRGIAIEGVELASERGLLRFADWRNSPCWIITDGRRMNSQARRIDGKPFTVEGQHRKAITLPGSRAGIPVGLEESRRFPIVAVVEGGADLLAAHGCIWAEDRRDVAAIAVLGTSNKPSAESLSVLAGKRVRVYCHRDVAGWTPDVNGEMPFLRRAHHKVDGFRFDGLRKADGAPVGDLNDFLALAPMTLWLAETSGRFAVNETAVFPTC